MGRASHRVGLGIAEEVALPTEPATGGMGGTSQQGGSVHLSHRRIYLVFQSWLLDDPCMASDKRLDTDLSSTPKPTLSLFGYVLLTEELLRRGVRV